jgi:hypothetical protein
VNGACGVNWEVSNPYGQKLDLAENTRYRQAGFEGTMTTLRSDLSLM